MSLRSALAGATTTAVVVAALGNPAAVDAARDADQQQLVATVVGFANWDVADAPGDVVGLVALRLGVLIVLAGLLCALVGRSRSRGAAFLGAWGAVGVAAAVGAAASYIYQVPVVLDGSAPAPTYGDGLVQGVNAGAAFALWTGWIVGLVVALFTRPQAFVFAPEEPFARTAVVRTAQPGARHIAEPPPPWWAPTHAADAGVRPGPTAFPPGGLGAPVVAGAGEPITPAPAPAPSASPGSPGSSGSPDASHEMTTVSGDPHPSDPDATHPVGLPPDAPAGDESESAEPHEPGGPVTRDADPDATITMDPAPEESDHTAEMPRRPDA
jgi:hypothetical protein